VLSDQAAGPSSSLRAGATGTGADRAEEPGGIYRCGVSNEPLADAHRRLADAEHGVERRLLRQADRLEDTEVPADPDGLRTAAGQLSQHAERHAREANRLSDRRDR